MSGIDYTKKSEIRNPFPDMIAEGWVDDAYMKSIPIDRNATGKQGRQAGLFSRGARYILDGWYYMMFAYRSRAEKWLLLSLCLMNITGLILVYIALGTIERPAGIEIYCPDE